jgi:uncharacterized lipoprotein YddW (UPF0748 family)
MKRIHLSLIAMLILLSQANLFAQPTPSKHEFRGVWVATVVNLDWPLNRTHSPASQQADMLLHFDRLKAAGFNAIFFQIRTENDALYDSPYEPWSYYLTGSEGSAPVPYWDPLAFAIEAAHARGLELHAWLNPYRSVRTVGQFTRDPNHVSITNPDWILQFNTLKILNPGLPEVIDYTTKIVMDVVRRYDVDGIHFDDYFYPYAPNTITNQDAATYAAHGSGFNNIGDWRRDNVNRMIKAVHDSIKTAKPHVKFGISPFGIWRPGFPSGISGTDAYATLYADAKAWIADQSVDYLIPQLYWAFGGSQDYAKLAPWWATESMNRHLYTGNAVYKMEGSWNWPTSEIGNQVRFNRNNTGIDGHVMFRSRLIHNNLKGIADSLRTNLFARPTLTPRMDWLSDATPDAPLALSSEWVDASAGTLRLTWDKPTWSQAGGDTLLRYAVYRVPASSVLLKSDGSLGALTTPENLIAIVGGVSFTDTLPPNSDPVNYVVTAVSRNSVESAPSMSVYVAPTSIDTDSEMATEIILAQNYPNPFNPSTVIRFTLPNAGPVRLHVYDLTGRLISVMVDATLPAGVHNVNFNGDGLSSGVYLYQLEAGGQKITQRMTLLK